MKTRTALLTAAIVATFAAGASAAYLSEDVHGPALHGTSIISALKADEGVPHILVTAMKADEGVPLNLVAGYQQDEGTPLDFLVA